VFVREKMLAMHCIRVAKNADTMRIDCDLTSVTAVGISAQNEGVAFTTTHWSVVMEAQGAIPAAQAALEKLCRTYWRPIYGFVRRQGVGPEEAKDLTQGFIALLLERRNLDAVRKEKGRLRSYLLTSVKHFLTNERNRALAIKRSQGQRCERCGAKISAGAARAICPACLLETVCP
jgi:hypothetical protein